MIVSIQKAWNILLATKLQTPSEKIPITEAAGRVASRPVTAENDSPPFDMSRFDGFACGLPTNHAPKMFRIVHEQPITAGDGAARALSEGEAAFIMTGAPLPRGTRLIVPREMCRVEGDSVMLLGLPDKERMILARGADFMKGETYLRGGETINPLHVGYMALDGRTEVDVHEIPSVSVLSIGNELEEVSKRFLGGAKIRNSHPALIQSLLRSHAMVVSGEHVDDDVTKITRALLTKLHSGCGIVVTTGGLGQGVKDLTRESIRATGASCLFEGIHAVPIGTFSCYQYGDKILFALPGGMVGVLLLTKLFLEPFAKKVQGMRVSKTLGPFPRAFPASDDAGFLGFHEVEHGNAPPVKFVKATLREENGVLRVFPLKNASLLEMNAFIVLNLENYGNDTFPVFPLWS